MVGAASLRSLVLGRVIVPTDGGLRGLLVRNLPRVHFQSVETWSTGQGVPDLNYCSIGVEGWIELKKSDGWVVDFSPQQIAWIERRLRAGGRVFVFVRRAGDELFILPGSAARPLLTRSESLRTIARIAFFSGGPRAWNYAEIGRILADRNILSS
jgi:hypothetical protein